MKASILNALLAPFKLIINPRALSPSYRVIEVGTKLRAACGWAYIETTGFDLGDKQAPVYVDGTQLLSIVASVPESAEFDLAVADGALHWECGAASGKIALAADVSVPAFTRRSKLDDNWVPPKDFATALSLGSLSGGTNALTTVGLFGVVIDNRRDKLLTVRACDNVTLSSCTIEVSKPIGPSMITLSPESVDVLALMFSRFAGGAVEFEAGGIFYKDDASKLFIQSVQDLSRDIRETDEGFLGEEVSLKLPAERIGAFIKRAGALAEEKRNTYVQLGAQKGRLLLSFSEKLASSDEHCLIEGLDVPDLPFVTLDAAKLARALSHASKLVLDHIEKPAVVLVGEKPAFRYIISGRKQ